MVRAAVPMMSNEREGQNMFSSAFDLTMDAPFLSTSDGDYAVLPSNDFFFGQEDALLYSTVSAGRASDTRSHLYALEAREYSSNKPWLGYACPNETGDSSYMELPRTYEAVSLSRFAIPLVSSKTLNFVNMADMDTSSTRDSHQAWNDIALDDKLWPCIGSSELCDESTSVLDLGLIASSHGIVPNANRALLPPHPQQMLPCTHFDLTPWGVLPPPLKSVTETLTLTSSDTLQVGPRRQARRTRTPGKTQFPCIHQSCNRIFKRRPDMLRHYAQIHSPSSEKLSCNRPGCRRQGPQGFARKDKLRDHRRAAHGVVE